MTVMIDIYHFFLKMLRKTYVRFFKVKKSSGIKKKVNLEDASNQIYDLLSAEKPCMIARFGSNELSCLINYMSIKAKSHDVLKYIKGEEMEWWWDKNIKYRMQNNTGFFPSTEENLSHFGGMMLNDLKQVDILGSWIYSERDIEHLMRGVSKIPLLFLEPYWAENPWSRILEGKKILVVHPFVKSIERQYNQRERLFKNPNVLPKFELQTVQAVQSLGGESNGFKDWFEALDWMKAEIDKKEYDICLVGCGAYGFPLAAHVKRQGKKAIHLGGALQLLFGIKGKRWEDPNYGEVTLKRKNAYLELMNEYWIYPDKTEMTKNAQKVENACYWN